MKNIRDKSQVEGLAEYDLIVPDVRVPAHIGLHTRKTDQELFKIYEQKFKREGSEFTIDDFFFFPAEISNQNLDSYKTKMAESSLRNYAEDATEGVAFLNSHRSRELGLGKVCFGEYVANEGDVPRVFADIYTVRGLQLIADLTTDNFIKGVQSGIISDVSIGFKEGKGYMEQCSICSRSYWDWECRHIPGMEYDVVPDPESDPTNQPKETREAFIWIVEGRLSEVSAVSDGATPEAMILTKAERELRAGRMSDSTKHFLESKYRFNFTPRRIFSGFSSEENNGNPKSEKEQSRKVMTDEEKQEAERIRLLEENAKKYAAFIRSICGSLGIEVKTESTDSDLMDSVRSEIPSVAGLAKQAKEYRETAITRTLEAGVRAFGKETEQFDQEKKRAMLEKLELNEILDFEKDWTSRANGKFKSGRTSVDETDDETDDESNRSSKVSVVPTSAFGNI